MNDRENFIRAARFSYPDKIPMNLHISLATWSELRHELEEIALRFPEFFPGVRKGWMDYDNIDFGIGLRKGEYVKDSWGCTWLSAIDGIVGCVVDSPIKTWDDLSNFNFPDPNIITETNCFMDWEKEKNKMLLQKNKDLLTYGGLDHGFMLMRYYYLRGFENAMFDFNDESEFDNTRYLLDKLYEYNKIIVDKYISFNVDLMGFPEDLGTQTSTIMSPEKLREWIFPIYKKLIMPCKEKGILVMMHSDGHTIDILEDMIGFGVDIVNPQDKCNGINELEKRIKGKAAILLDVDRQDTLPFGTPVEINDLIEEEVKRLGSPQGGLMFIAGIYPPTPPKNIEALCLAMRKYENYWSDKR